MNRRTFLKSLAATCGAAVVCPGELLKCKSMPAVGRGERAKHIYMIDHSAFHNIIVKARQQGYTNSTFYTMHNFGGRRSGFIVTRPT